MGEKIEVKDERRREEAGRGRTEPINYLCAYHPG